MADQAPSPDWLFIDGSSLIFRAFYGVPGTIRAPDGRQVNAVRGFAETITRLLYSRHPVRLAVASDEDWRPQHRVDLIASYKAHRVAEPVPPALEPQMPLIHALLDAVGIEFVGAPTLEAEDVIASWVEQLSGTIEIVSGDRDLFALVRGPDVTVLYPEKSGLTVIDEAEVTRRYGIPGRRYADFAVLRGDPSDGLPGLPGVGAKTAAQLIRTHGDIAALLESGALSDSGAAYVRRAMAVVLPGSEVPVPPPQGRRATWPSAPEALRPIAEELGLTDTVERLVQALRATLTG
jgi:5'-3' exonuclease